MKAAQYNSYGAPDVIEINSNAPVPSLKEGQVLVEVRAASINPFDYKVRRGYVKDTMPLTFPVTIGGDLSGVLKEVAPGVSEFAAGDEVFGQALVVGGGSGSLAELAAAKTKNIAKKPKNLSFPEAASLALVGCSAVQALEDHIHLQKGQKILINGGAGGIGSIAIQLAKYLDAYVITTVSTKDIEFVKQLGADEVIDYKIQQFETVVKDLDTVFDTVGGETFEKSYGVLKKGGILVSMAGQPDENKANELGITVIGQSTHTTTEHLNRVRELAESNAIKPQIEKIFPLIDTRAAYEYLETAHPKGKVVVNIQD